MFFIWERRVRRQHSGSVKKYCPICSVSRPHAIYTYSTREYVYLMPLSPGQAALTELVCDECGPTFARLLEVQAQIESDRDEGRHLDAALRACEWPLTR